MNRVLTRVRRLSVGEDSGISLIEAVISLLLASLVLTALAYAAVGAVRASLASRQTQQAIDLATQRIEQIRALDYAAIALRPTDITSDPRIVPCGSRGKCVRLGASSQGGSQVTAADGLAVGEQINEPVLSSTTGFTPHITTVTGTGVNNTEFTLSTYVSTPVSPTDAAAVDAATADLRRVSVVVEWTTAGKTSSQTLSTFITYQQRGLPLPRFKLIAKGPTALTVNPLVQASFGFTLTNQGAPDRWNLTSSGAQSWTYVRDDGDGLFDPSTDTSLLTDTNSDGAIDTGYLAPTASITYWAYRTVTEGVGTYTTTFTATSALQPDMASGVNSVVDRLTVVTGVISPTPTPTPTPTSTATATATPTATSTPTSTATSTPTTVCAAATPVPTVSPATGYSTVTYTLHNTSSAVSWPSLPLASTDPIPGSVALGPPMYMDSKPVAIPAGRTLPVYSSDSLPAGTGGRILAAGGDAKWATQSRIKSYTGSAVVKFWVAAVPGVATSSISLGVQAFQVANTSSAIGSEVPVTVSPFTCSGFQQVSASLPLGNVKLTGLNVLTVRIRNTGATAVRLGYDTAEMPAALVVNEK